MSKNKKIFYVYFYIILYINLQTDVRLLYNDKKIKGCTITKKTVERKYEKFGNE